MFGRARFAECRTIMRLFDAFQNQSANTLDRLLGIDLFHVEEAFGVMLAKFPTQLITAFWDGADAAPFAIADLKHLVDQFLSRAIAFTLNDAGILIFDFGPALLELADCHQGTL